MIPLNTRPPCVMLIKIVYNLKIELILVFDKRANARGKVEAFDKLDYGQRIKMNIIYF